MKLAVVFDTNCFAPNFSLRAPDVSVILQKATQAGFSLYVPEVVLLESKNQIREAIEEGLQNVQQSMKNLRRLVDTDSKNALDSLELPDATQLVAKRQDAFERRLRGAGFRVLDHPDVPHRNLLERDLARRPPFARDGTGYRDALIWHTLLDFVSDRFQRVVFVSNNSKDFGKGRLAPSLADELPFEGAIELLNQPSEFVAKYLNPRLEPTAEWIGERVTDIEALSGGYYDRIVDSILDEIDGYDSLVSLLPTREIGDMQVVEQPYEIEEWALGSIRSAAQIEESHWLIECDVDVTIGGFLEHNWDSDDPQEAAFDLELTARCLVNIQNGKVETEITDVHLEESRY